MDGIVNRELRRQRLSFGFLVRLCADYGFHGVDAKPVERNGKWFLTLKGQGDIETGRAWMGKFVHTYYPNAMVVKGQAYRKNGIQWWEVLVQLDVPEAELREVESRSGMPVGGPPKN